VSATKRVNQILAPRESALRRGGIDLVDHQERGRELIGAGLGRLLLTQDEEVAE